MRSLTLEAIDHSAITYFEILKWCWKDNNDKVRLKRKENWTKQNEYGARLRVVCAILRVNDINVIVSQSLCI
jgi:hypothetical protein